ncbi:uncharacterized protein LOC114330569 [Diabrotica virgifera virgifera]|uniref:Uncharacterized protein LOC114330569 n=1 Tax=Diabrotica virgifera virgifera TaxID=50390 RepID=A0A6P7FS03_DIAVI|nr:uncharacterized protein LOC114330569 [Diabrotica virgifera virgifera]
MRSLILATIVLFAVYQTVDADGLIACHPNFCNDSHGKCTENLVCSDSEILVPKGSLCGCCDDCYRKLNEGEACRSRFFGGGPFRGKCVDGLECNAEGKCAKVY